MTSITLIPAYGLPDAAGAIVPDFPLINKSFNLSYAGNDLWPTTQHRRIHDPWR